MYVRFVLEAKGALIGRLLAVWRSSRARPGAIQCSGRNRGWPLLQKLMGVIVTVLVLVWIISNPAGAGNMVHDWIAGIITFFAHLA
jgi:hypothetical protein